VPSYHSRLMHQLLPESGPNSTYNEVPDQSHWWNGVLTTPALADFYETQLQKYLDGEVAKSADEMPEQWELVTANPAETGSKHGVKILLLEKPGQLGRVSIRCIEHERESLDRETQVPLTDDDMPVCSLWQITTSNVRMFSLPMRLFGTATLRFENGPVRMPENGMSTASTSGNLILERSDTSGSWCPVLQTLETPQRVRWGRQLGSLDALLRTTGAIQIRTHLPSSSLKEETNKHGAGVERLALQISQNLQTYFYANSDIHTHMPGSEDLLHDTIAARPGNVVSLALGKAQLPALHDYPISVLPSGQGISVRDQSGSMHNYTTTNTFGFSEKGGGSEDVSAIFLRPVASHSDSSQSGHAQISHERVEIVIWGCSIRALEQAARLVPMMTGTGQPDFVVLGGNARWKSVDGARAMGWLDEHWQVTENSYVS
jgi:hypothetical protein